jgi:hypothetical protein
MSYWDHHLSVPRGPLLLVCAPIAYVHLSIFGVCLIVG